MLAAGDLQGAITRAFLFADLRGYTDFVERRGAAAAAELLTRYRTLAREAIGQFGGAEIKTEGDSFYVVFDSVSSAVRCGLAITAAARAEDEPIRVGVGIHAGETIEADGGYVGSPVNIAARICSQAGAGEVLVSETVRALTMTLLPMAAALLDLRIRRAHPLPKKQPIPRTACSVPSGKGGTSGVSRTRCVRVTGIGVSPPQEGGNGRRQRGGLAEEEAHAPTVSGARRVLRALDGEIGIRHVPNPDEEPTGEPRTTSSPIHHTALSTVPDPLAG